MSALLDRRDRDQAAVDDIPVPPHSVEAEQAVLGALMLDNRAWDTIADRLVAGDFYRRDHQLIFEAIADLAGRGEPFDEVTLSAYLARKGIAEETGGIVYLAGLPRDTPSAANVRAYADAVRERSTLRRLITVGGKIAASAYDPEGRAATELVDEAAAALQTIQVGSSRNERELIEIEPASAWADRDPPPERDNVVEGLAIYAGRTSLLTSNGGLGKTNIAMQMLIACAVNRALYGYDVRGGTALGFFCEDEQHDCERRIRLLCAADGIDLSSLDRLHVRSLDGEDNVICTFVRDQIVLTDRYWQIDATFEQLKPRLAVLDTVADLFAGDFMSTPHVRQFVKIAIGGLAARHGSAILLLAHPSQSAMNSGDGGGFSVAWNNSVRSRLYLRRPKSDDAEAIADRRVLEVRKSNYGPSGNTIPLMYERGCFRVDPAPIEEGGARVLRSARTDTRLAVAVMNHFSVHAASGSVVMFRGIFEALQRAGDIPAGHYETVRKPLQRALKALVEDKLLVPTEVPRGGYRLNRPTESGK